MNKNGHLPTQDDYANWIVGICRNESKHGFLLSTTYKNAPTVMAANKSLNNFLKYFYRETIGPNWRRRSIAKRIRPFGFLDVPCAKVSIAARQAEPSEYQHHIIILADEDKYRRIRNAMDWQMEYQWKHLNDITQAKTNNLKYMPTLDDVYEATHYASKTLPYIREAIPDALLLPKRDSILLEPFDIIKGGGGQHGRIGWELDRTRKHGSVWAIKPTIIQPTETKESMAA